MKGNLLLVALLIVVNVFSQSRDSRQQELQMFNDNVFHLSEVMLHDVVNPPAASRFYAYSLLGAYEAALLGGVKVPGLNSKFNVPLKIKSSVRPKNFNLTFCSIYTMLDVGRQLMPSGYLLEKNQLDLVGFFQTKLSNREITLQIRYAKEIADQVVQYAKRDDYNKLSTYTRYSPSKEEGRWHPTPPEYMAAVEPRWETVRSFFLDSADRSYPSAR